MADFNCPPKLYSVSCETLLINHPSMVNFIIDGQQMTILAYKHSAIPIFNLPYYKIIIDNYRVGML